MRPVKLYTLKEEEVLCAGSWIETVHYDDVSNWRPVSDSDEILNIHYQREYHRIETYHHHIHGTFYICFDNQARELLGIEHSKIEALNTKAGKLQTSNNHLQKTLLAHQEMTWQEHLKAAWNKLWRTK